MEVGLQAIIMTETPGAEAGFDPRSASSSQINMMIAEQDGVLSSAVEQFKCPMDHIRMRLFLQCKLGANDALKEWRQLEAVY